MGKKKKKKRQSIMDDVDANLMQAYQELMDDIKKMQNQLIIADVQAKKKVKKYKKKHPGNSDLYNNDTFRMHVRNEILQDMQNTNFLDRVYKALHDIAPIIIIIARLVASLILSILSMDIVKIHIKPDMLNKLTTVYNTAMAIG